jgi:hypothetical protein
LPASTWKQTGGSQMKKNGEINAEMNAWKQEVPGAGTDENIIFYGAADNIVVEMSLRRVWKMVFPEEFVAQAWWDGKRKNYLSLKSGKRNIFFHNFHFLSKPLSAFFTRFRQALKGKIKICVCVFLDATKNVIST